MKKLMHIVLFLMPAVSLAVPLAQTKVLRTRAYFKETDNKMLEALDLKAKTYTFTNQDFEECLAVMMRKAKSLTYSCTLTLPSAAKTSRMQSVDSPLRYAAFFAGSKREVQVQVSDDARKVTLTTAFDPTGFDFEMNKFNDDFYSVYAKSAQTVIRDAINGHPLRIEVLEDR